MVEDVYEPLARYRDEFCDKFAKLAAEKFRALLAASGVDVKANQALVAEIRRLEAAAAGARRRKGWWTFATVLAFLAVAGLGAWAYFLFDAGDKSRAGLAAGGAAAALLLALTALLPARNRAADAQRRLERQAAARKDEAWRQMAPLNALYDWDITTRLIEATVPRLAFDPFFTEGRLAELTERFGWNPGDGDDRSVLFAQSGTINGNPFVFGHRRRQTWGEETYHGSRTIRWTEYETDEKGRPRPVLRSETLHASVTKPKPEYGEDKFLVYGNDAAPDLCFTRRPSPLSALGDGAFDRLRKRRAARKLEKFSRNLDDDSEYTLMGNKEFETLFDTRDRNHEVQYRLLFTALAQEQMLALLKDRSVGFGDDFTFAKRRRANVIRAAHLSEFPIDTDPARFFDYDVRAAARNFRAFNEAYFKSVYFALAPLLAVPLYQQTRTPEEIWKGVAITPSSYWEHESAANWLGDDRFKARDCVTPCVLKTSLAGARGGARLVDVTAHGFRGVPRVENVSKFGGDGRWHDVPVEWTEYLPTVRTVRVEMEERRGVSLQAHAAAAPRDFFRRAIAIRFR